MIASSDIILSSGRVFNVPEKADNMRAIDTKAVDIAILDNDVVLVEAKYGVEINSVNSMIANDLIASEISGNYGLILNRKKDYSIVPVDVYEVLNSMERLKAIAVVLYNETSKLGIVTEQHLFKGALAIFDNVEDARVWLKVTVVQ